MPCGSHQRAHNNRDCTDANLIPGWPSGASAQRESCGPSGSIVMVSHPQQSEGTQSSQTVAQGCDQAQAIPGPEELSSAKPQRSQRPSPSCASISTGMGCSSAQLCSQKHREQGPVQVPGWALLLLLLFLAAREQQRVLEEPPILSPQPSAWDRKTHNTSHYLKSGHSCTVSQGERIQPEVRENKTLISHI